MNEAERQEVVVREPLQRSIIARPIAGNAVHTIIGPEPGQRGPWSFITDTPHPTQDMVGPPATYLAVAALAACTGVTVVGVAYRGHIPLQDIRVDFQVDPIAHPPVPGVGARKTLTPYRSPPTTAPRP